EGTVGLITYMRTDSLRISEEALAGAKDFILERYGKTYYPATTRRFKAKAGAQDAHEAIRPSNIRFTPEQIKGDLTSEQYRLYRLIWSRFLASQMANAVYDSIAVEIGAGSHEFRASASELKFSGYTAVYEESRDEEKEEKTQLLPALAEGQIVLLQGFEEEQHFTAPPSRYTDATLIRAMEQNGIGRPSTYAPTVSTIIDREYVAKEGKFLRITPLGSVVTELMEQRFANIVDTKFTARMEKQLDTVEEGEENWKEVLRSFYGDFSESLTQAEAALEGTRIKVPDEVTEEKCDLCGRNMVVKTSRFGRFLACPGYPDCKFTKPIVVEMPGRCPKCGERILKKTSRKGYAYYGCEKNPACDFMTWDVPVKDDCPQCGQTLFKKSGKGFKKPFCINPECSAFVPEEKRGYVRKKTAETAEDAVAEKTTSKKTAAKATAKKTAEKKTATKKTAEKKTAVKKTATKKTAAKKTAKKEEA
ncbi:MAG: type I DNA topoisomerase, partial [Oscillospiraceae bacterium]|nr:type I DNA topoisomerase [Oscillospiraceae bacterium]